MMHYLTDYQLIGITVLLMSAGIALAVAVLYKTGYLKGRDWKDAMKHLQDLERRIEENAQKAYNSIHSRLDSLEKSRTAAKPARKPAARRRKQ